MAFYIKPPEGHTHLSNLQTWALKRLQFLITVYGCQGNLVALKDLTEEAGTVNECECLLEGTKKDAVSHFFLR